MSFFVLVAGSLVGDPQRRAGAKGPFTTATIRTSGDEAVLVSIIAFSDEAERLLEFVKGDAIAVSGRARLTSWTGRDGAERHGISLVAEQIAAVKPRPRVDARQHAASASYPSRASGHAAALPDDRVDDLWPAEGAQ